jgi:uncharacterized protein (TIGR02596 family)
MNADKFQQQAFSLIELLVVIAILGILSVLITPALRSISSGNQVTAAANQIAAALILTRQVALAETRQMELRIFKLPDETGSNFAYRGFQLAESSSGEARERLQRLPSGIVLLDDAKFSTILNEAANPGILSTNLPVYGNVDYKVIRFTSSGGTTLPSVGSFGGSDQWFLSLKQEHAPSGGADKPADNYATILVDPVVGRVQVFRP